MYEREVCMHSNKTSRRRAFTLVEIMIVVAIIGLLAAIAIPNFIKARTTSQANGCIDNLRQIDGAITEWALENGQASGNAPPTLVNLVTLGYVHTPGGNDPQCPAGGTYIMNVVGGSPQVTCSLGNSVTPAHVAQ